MAYQALKIKEIITEETKIKITGSKMKSDFIDLSNCHNLQEIKCNKTENLIFYLSPKSELCLKLYESNLLKIETKNLNIKKFNLYELDADYITDGLSISIYNNEISIK